MVYGIILFCVTALLTFGYLVDKRTEHYKTMTDKKAKEEIEAIKDETQGHNPTHVNQTPYL